MPGVLLQYPLNPKVQEEMAIINKTATCAALSARVVMRIFIEFRSDSTVKIEYY